MADASAVAFSIVNQLRDLLKQQGYLFLETGKLLKMIRDEKYYEALGYEAWLDFVNSDEVGIGKSTVYSYIGIYEMFVLKYGMDYEYLADIPWDKLSLALPAVRKAGSKEEVEELVEKARTLSRSDLMVALSDHENEKKEAPKTRMVKLFKHETCGRWFVDIPQEEMCRCEFNEQLIKVRKFVADGNTDEALTKLDKLINL